MILKWGSYAHANNEVGIRIANRSIFDTFNRRMGEIQTWTIIGAIHANSKSALTTALNTLETEYASDYRDLCLYLDDGITKSKHELTNASTFGGTKVTGFGYISGPWKMNTEYANRRSFYVTVQGERRVGTGQWAWRERVRIRGTGGAKFIYMPRLSGSPVSQTIQTGSTFFYVQEGSAIGRTAYIAPPGPLYAGIEHVELREITYHTPSDMRVGANQMYRTDWRYVMEATTDAGFSAFTIPTIT